MKKDIKASAKRRLSIIGGQVKGINEMVEKEVYCVDIITQIEAAREALAGLGNLILENHLETHIAHQFMHGQEKKATAEILKVYKLKRK